MRLRDRGVSVLSKRSTRRFLKWKKIVGDTREYHCGCIRESLHSTIKWLVRCARHRGVE